VNNKAAIAANSVNLFILSSSETLPDGGNVADEQWIRKWDDVFLAGARS
jgi:hypothetical protein